VGEPPISGDDSNLSRNHGLPHRCDVWIGGETPSACVTHRQTQPLQRFELVLVERASMLADEP
jgi:hypothetical protein